MKYKTEELGQFYIVGISVRTTNQNMQSKKDIGDLWTKYMIESLGANIHNKVTNDTYCVYTDYENDANEKYTTILGCRVKSLDSIPADMIGIIVSPSKYQVYASTGKLPDCVVGTWMYIWQSDIPRKYIADFDVYGPKAQNPSNAEVETYISVK